MLKKDRRNLTIFLIVTISVFIGSLLTIKKDEVIFLFTGLAFLITGFPVITGIIKSGIKYFTQEDKE